MKLNLTLELAMDLNFKRENSLLLWKRPSMRHWHLSYADDLTRVVILTDQQMIRLSDHWEAQLNDEDSSW